MHSKMFSFTVLGSFLFLAVSCGGGDKAAEAPPGDEPAEKKAEGVPPDLSQAGSIAGKVSFEGTAPKSKRIRMDADPVCTKQHSDKVYSQDVIVNENGTLSNVFVWIKTGLEQYSFPTPSEQASLDQKSCLYTPHVIGVQVKQEIKILNSDPTTHNIHPLPKNNREWNQSQRAQGKPLIKSFPRVEVMVPVKCNVHPWMKSYVGVVAHPYFIVTGAEGSFELKDVPPGDYVIEAWHEKFGATEQKVTVGASESKEVSFSFTG